jgi:DNA-binding winged helix-turn-helix (wHTH) protein
VNRYNDVVLPATVYAFGPYQFDASAARLTRDGEAVHLSQHQLDVLACLVAHAGSVVSKDTLVMSAWRGVAVTDNSLEQAISVLRRALGHEASGEPYIRTVARSGYRFVASVVKVMRRESDADIQELLAPYRTWIEGRTALESLAIDQVDSAERAFESVLKTTPDYAAAHVGLANACAFRFEATRADSRPQIDALVPALHHAREACRLESHWAETWATLGFVMYLAGDPAALAASRRAAAVEADNWRHHLRLAFVSWGEERLRAAARTLHLMPGLGLAHWLAATVHVARQTFELAERELEMGAEAQDQQPAQPARFGAIGSHWLLGLVRWRQGDDRMARQEFERELSFESEKHLYSRECCANARYAIGALEIVGGRRAEALRAFEECLRGVPGHERAEAARSFLTEGAQRFNGDSTIETSSSSALGAATVETAIVTAVRASLRGDHNAASNTVLQALATAPAGNAGWLIPVEPLLQVSIRGDAWAGVLRLLRTRAA